jgi:hypothetical protein
MRGLIRVLVVTSEGKRPLGRTSHGKDNNIKIDFEKWKVAVWNMSSCHRIGTFGVHM